MYRMECVECGYQVTNRMGLFYKYKMGPGCVFYIYTHINHNIYNKSEDMNLERSECLLFVATPYLLQSHTQLL